MRDLLFLLLATPLAEASDTGDTAVDCGTPYTSDTADTDGGSSGAGQDHGSPENGLYDIDGFDDVRNCAQCHPNHYDEWHGSIHAYAATNPVMWHGSREIGETTEFPLNCMGCHAPISTLTGVLTDVDVVYDKSQLPEAAAYGVSCVSCHKLYDVYNGVNQFTHCDDYYFGTIDDPEPTTYHGNGTSSLHSEALVCRSCHNVENINHVQVEFTYTEWLDANEAAGGEEFEPAIQTCQDCHMPAYTGPAATGGPDRTVHRHTFVGGDVALQPFPDAHRQYRAVQALMATAGQITATPVYVEGGFAGADVAVTNLIEGHDLPSGSAFDRQVWVEIYITDHDGNVLVESGTLDENGDLRDWNSELQPESDYWITQRLSVFRSYLSDETGAETFSFIGEATAIEDDSLAAGETRYIRYFAPEIGPDTALPITVETRLLYRPFPPFLLRKIGMDEDLVLSVPIYEIARDTLVVESLTE